MFPLKPGRLIVSCQPSGDESPLNQASAVALIASAAERAGATALRVGTPEHLAAVKAATALPVIGLWKRADVRGNRVITPDFESARTLAEAGADVIAVDATARAHPVPGLLAQLIQQIQQELSLPVLADVSNAAEGIRAAGYGADLVATTLSGYTPHSPQQAGPDLDLVQELVSAIDVPVVAEGRYTCPDQARAALEAGAAFVVVGGAITAPDVQTARFIAVMAPTMAEPSAEAYWAAAGVAIARVQATQGPAIRDAADLVVRAIRSGGAVRVLGDRAFGMELGDRSGGLVPVCVGGEWGPADVFMIVGGAGELAQEVKRQGHALIVVSGAQADMTRVADVVIDNGAPAGDAVLAVPGLAQRVGAVSGVTGALIAQALTVEILRRLQTTKMAP